MAASFTDAPDTQSSELPRACSWQPPPNELILQPGEVHVWRASLELEASRLRDLLPTLSTHEQGRAERFHFARDRGHFIAAHGLLRAILGRYLRVGPGQLRFGYGLHGKPVLKMEPGGGALRFNMSHSHGLALYAVAADREVGIDVEQIRSDVEPRRVADQFFSPGEVAALLALPTHLQRVAFFNCWTRKEAYIKAKGKGMSLPLQGFEVSLVPGEPAALLKTCGDPAEAGRWSLRALEPGPGYVGAVAAEGRDWDLRCWQWHEP